MGNTDGMLGFLPQASCTPGQLRGFHKALPTRPQVPRLLDETLDGMGPEAPSSPDSRGSDALRSPPRAGWVLWPGRAGVSPITPKAGGGVGGLEEAGSGPGRGQVGGLPEQAVAPPPTPAGAPGRKGWVLWGHSHRLTNSAPSCPEWGVENEGRGRGPAAMRVAAGGRPVFSVMGPRDSSLD